VRGDGHHVTAVCSPRRRRVLERHDHRIECRDHHQARPLLGREAVDVNEVCWSLWRLERTRADRRSICFRRRVDPIHVASTLRR
jgi:hypothetical protein